MKKFLIAATAACFLFVGTAMADQQQQATAEVNGVGATAGFQGDVGSNNKSIGAPIPGGVNFGPVLNYFGQPLPSEGFQPVEQLIMYTCWFTEGSLESMLKGVEKVHAEFKVATNRVKDAPLAEDGSTRWIKIVIQTYPYGMEMVREGKTVKYIKKDVNFKMKGFVTAKSEHPNTTMTEVMAKAALVALQNGCNVIHFTAQGAVRDVISSGWGIGFNTTQAQIYSGDMTKSNVTSGGMGYSKAKAGTRDFSWLQSFALIDYDLVYPALKVVEEVPAEK
jgi:hypothetical protein